MRLIDKFSILFITFLLLPAAAASSVEIQNVTREESGKLLKKCDLNIYFGSYGSGVNRKYSEKTKAYIVKSGKIQKAYIGGHGREGEHFYCLISENIKLLITDLKALLPKKSDLGPIVLTEKGKKSFKISNPNFKNR